MNENTPANRNCPKCGAPLSPTTVDGLCPACLLALNLAAQTELTGETGPHGTKIVSPTMPTPAPADIAKFFPQLEIIECLGRGGMGVVYKARQPRLNRLVALKILAPGREQDPAFSGRFVTEAQALARLSHPNIVTIHDFGETGGMYFLLMEYVDGITLRQLLARRRISPREALAIVPQICDALQFAHDQGIVHRDIKPENILMDRRGRVKVADFGLAKMIGGEAEVPQGESVMASASLTEAGKVLGTPNYMAPEQVSHPAEVDHRADIYALGVVFYQMLTGELPEKSLQPPSNKVHIDVRLDEVVLRALEKEPSRRYQQAGDIKTQVETIATSMAQPHADAAAAVENAVRTISECAENDPRAEEALRSLRPWNPEQVTALLAQHLQSGKDAVRRAAIFILWKGAFASIGPAVAPLQGLLRHAENFTRGMAALALGANHIVDSYAAVAAMARDDRDEYARRCANMALQSFGDVPPGQPPQTPFGAASATPPRFSRTAIVGALCAAITLVSLFLALIINAKTKVAAPEILRLLNTPGSENSRVVNLWSASIHLNRYLFTPLAFAGVLATTILGWVAVAQIRRGKGKLRGLGLAVLDGLFFPCLFVGGLILLIVVAVARALFEHKGVSPIPIGLGAFGILLPLAILGALLVRWVWLVAKKPLGGATSPAGKSQPPSPPPIGKGGPLSDIALTLAALSGLLGTVAWFHMPEPPQLLVWSILVASLGGIFLGMLTRKTLHGKTAIIIGGANAAVWLIVFTLFALFAVHKSSGGNNTSQRLANKPGEAAMQAFGPVVERAITLGDRSDSFYSFDEESYIAPPQDFDPTSHSEADTQKLWKWLTDHHADLLVTRKDGQPILTMSDMVTAVIDEKDFDRLTPERLAENEVWRGALAAQFRPSEQSVLKGAGDGKIAVAFQTRYNVTGMLQMIGVDSDPPGVKIRYKLEAK